MTFLLLDTNGLFKSVRNKLLESGKELVVVVALWIICLDPRSVDETVEYMPLQQCFHLLLELHAELIPVTLVLSMDEKSGEKVDVLDVQPTTTACEQVAATIIKRQLGLDETMLARTLPPIKISVEVTLCVIEYQASPAWVVGVFRKGCCEISQNVTPQRVRPQVEPYRQQCRTTSIESPWRAYLDLDFRITEKCRSNKVLDTLKKQHRRTSIAQRRQHKTQRGTRMFVVVDVEDFLRSSKTPHQSRELTPVAEAVDTHHLVFYQEILAGAAAHTPQVPTMVNLIGKRDGRFGVITENDEPWIAKKVVRRTEALRDRLQEITAANLNRDSDGYRRQAKDFYTDLREAWERLVEELLLNGVVERFCSGVKTQSLREVVVEDGDYQKIFAAMKRVSEFSGHDMAAGRQIPVPDLNEMRRDLDEIDAYRTEIQRRRDGLRARRCALEEPPAAQVI